MLMKRTEGRVSPLGGSGKCQQKHEEAESKERLWARWKVRKSGRCGQRACNVFLKHRSFSQKRGRFSQKRWTFSEKRRRFSGISRTFLRRRSEGDKRKQRGSVCCSARVSVPCSKASVKVGAKTRGLHGVE